MTKTTIDVESFLSSGNSEYLFNIYNRYLKNRHSVGEDWQEVFAVFGDKLLDIDQELQNGINKQKKRTHSYAHAEMSDAQLTRLTNGKGSSTYNRKSFESEAVEKATLESIQAIMLIRAYRIRGHLLADLDPLKLNTDYLHAELDPEHYGFLESDMDKPIFLNYVLGLETATLREILGILKSTYCSSIGIEFMQTQDPNQKLWLQHRIELTTSEQSTTKREHIRRLKLLARAELFEKFLSKKHTGVKRFGLEGAESIVVLVEHILRVGSKLGLKDVAIGMAHRGRLNFIANLFRKPYRAIFSEFKGNSSLPSGMDFSGDVKYHLGTSCDREFGNLKLHLSLTANPSHLEAVNTVVIGKVRAKQQLRNDKEHEQVMGLLLHGDASFSGQGVVAETFLMSKLYGYRTGGTLHIIINNQIGFTTSPAHSRSSTYCSDTANVVGAPIFHVNGDDIEACIKVAEIAIEYRYKFKSDIVIDVICYRKHGHNESDDPFFTQPLMYKAIAKQQSTYVKYQEKLLSANIISKSECDAIKNDVTETLQQEYDLADSYKPNKADWLEGIWKGFKHKKLSDTNTATGVDLSLLKTIGKKITSIPNGFNANSKILRQLNHNNEIIESGANIGWSLGEALAIGSILVDGKNVRLSGEDCRRGTFSQRHAVLTDQINETPYTPLNHITMKQKHFEVLDSPLSEYGVLGFEYGYASVDPNTLVIWEAQFGDFANGAQVIIDQFIASGEVKWLRMNGLVLLLPHGFEGQGPEHSSARLERFLQLSADHNWFVCNLSTPANYFHALRRQMQSYCRKPLVLMTPKSLLRHKSCVSKLSDMESGSVFHPIIGFDNVIKGLQDDGIKRLIFCSGKIYYDLIQKLLDKSRNDIYIIRIEQLYPFPGKEVEKIVARFKKAEIVWCQEEPKNMGAWNFIDRLLEQALKNAKTKQTRPIYIGRDEAASPATGLMKFHLQQQELIINTAINGKI